MAQIQTAVVTRRPRTPTDDVELERLVARAAEGDEQAWRSLWSRLTPRLTALIVARTFVRRSRLADDETRDVIVAVMGRLRERGFARLRGYLDARRGDRALGFMPWIIVVTKRVAIDVMRAHPDYMDRRRSWNGGRWIESAALSDAEHEPSAASRVTEQLAARQIARYAQGVLSAAQRRALLMWVEDRGSAEIARALALADAGVANRLVRAAVERLRRHFRREPASCEAGGR